VLLSLFLSVDESSSISIHNKPTLFLILHLFPAKTVYKYVIAPPEDVPLFAVDESRYFSKMIQEIRFCSKSESISGNGILLRSF
jgi:hypothetical protein